MASREAVSRVAVRSVDWAGTWAGTREAALAAGRAAAAKEVAATVEVTEVVAKAVACRAATEVGASSHQMGLAARVAGTLAGEP